MGGRENIHAKNFFLSKPMRDEYHTKTNTYHPLTSITQYRPLFGGILAAALHILFRYLDYDLYNPGIDAENHAQYIRAKAAAADQLGLSGQNQASRANRGLDGTTTTNNNNIDNNINNDNSRP